MKRRDKQACAAGLYYSVAPSALNGTILLANEWQDIIRLHCNHAPLDMPDHCDDCRVKMMVKHALSCKIGGLVHIRHNDVADEYHHMKGAASSFRKVTRKPRIDFRVSQRVTVGESAQGNPIAANSTTNDGETEHAASNILITGERRDARVHLFWERGHPCL